MDYIFLNELQLFLYELHFYNLGPIVEPTLPQSQPQPEPHSDPKPLIEIPIPNKNTITGNEMQAITQDDVLFKDVCILTVNTYVLNIYDKYIFFKIR